MVVHDEFERLGEYLFEGHDWHRLVLAHLHPQLLVVGLRGQVYVVERRHQVEELVLSQLPKHW